jgi:cation transport ATPase
VPIAIIAGLSRAAKYGISRAWSHWRQMANVRSIVIDKTATLTAAEPESSQ